MKLSERLMLIGTSDRGFSASEATTLAEAYDIVRAVEGAATVEWSRDSGIACAHLRGQLVRIVPEKSE